MSTIQLFKVHMNSNAPAMVSEVMMSGMITQSTRVELFEEALKDYFNWPYILTLNSATSGLTLAYKLLDLQDTDEIISTPLTCFATTCAILSHNKRIVWADTDPQTCNIDLDNVKSRITKDTRVLSFVHWAGYPVDLDKVEQLKKYANETFGTNINVVEDCAHSFGATWNNKNLGCCGNNIAVYSLQAIKHLTTGDGGLILLPNKEMYERAKLLRWYGISRERRSLPGTDFRLEPDISEWGYKFHMNDINAAIGLANLPDMKNNIKKHRDNAMFFDNSLKDNKIIKILNRDARAVGSYWIYTVRVTKGLKPFFIKFMNRYNIVTSQVHSRNDKNSCVSQFKTSLPKLDILEKELVSIPCGWWLTHEQRSFIVDRINSFSELYNPKLITLDSSRFEEYCVLRNIDVKSCLLTKELSDTIFLLLVNDEIVSSAKLFIEDKICDPVGHIEDVITKETMRCFGFGKMVVKLLVNKGLMSGCYKIVLNCKPELGNFYKSCGLKETGVSYTIRNKV